MDYGRMLKLAEIIGKYQKKRQAGAAANVSDRASVLDKRINTPELATIRSAIPYLEPKNRKLVNIIVKLIEIQRLLDYLNETAAAVNELEPSSDGWRASMLELIKPHLPPNTQAELDTLIAFMEIAGTLKTEV